MRDLRSTLVLAATSVALVITGCNSNYARYSDPSESLVAGHYYRSYSSDANLWDRVRSGMRLNIPDNERVERFVRWYSEHPSYLDRMQKNAETYLFHIVEAIEKRGMPMELALLPAVESNYTPTARSHAGAVGMWQFISSTGKIYGLEQNALFDERRHVTASTEAALDYLNKLHDQFGGDWELAMAAYNAGEGAVGRARTRAESRNQPTDYWSLDLPTETEEYVPRLLALATLVKKPRKHGVELGYIPNHPKLAEIETTRTIDLVQAAERCGIDKDEFCKLNAAYLTSITTSQAKHRILVPADKADKLRTVLAQLPEIQPSRIASISAPPARNTTYRVKRGDTLTGVATRFGVSVDQLRSANKLKGSQINVGQKLVIKGGKQTSGRTTLAAAPSSSTSKQSAAVSSRYKVQSGDTLSSIARRFDVSVAQLQQTNQVKGGMIKVGQTLTINGKTAKRSAGGQKATAKVYKVKSGDTIWSIAQSHQVKVDLLLAHNGLSNKTVIKPGQTLKIPNQGSV